ncbi:phosphate acyltransferase PlsX [Candidatus Hydrogenosomobacter endosymbioticus]|uniref:Phosphate acyltransferase n=1 Tax=Candidatus Hydrogenosomobacter endosymbioticus TaxID=2558174 RepID=A0ABM7V9V8_9PROT|nr:phosphate acyltransferase PlsX [Candidatus Hydrogenosomobacter endosymbioticus]BDB96560.1 phosphate acyltransferase [Candidatus Hydrogenosomobacter endosymbioticus]
MPIVAVDGMGGDRAPGVVVRGMAIFSERLPEFSFVLFGDERELSRLVNAEPPSLRDRVCIIHTDQVVSTGEKPSRAVRGMARSSMRLALEAVVEGAADGVISAGNTGAYMALSKVMLKTLPGIARPAIASQIPTERGESIMLDLGGSLSCTSKNLVDFAVMGSVFAKHVLGVDNPSVGLLNVGSEETKGDGVLQEAASIIKSRNVNFYGFIEGDDISSGVVDVMVTDGFTGNIALKTGEGVMKLLMNSLKKSLSSSTRGRLAMMLAKPLLLEMTKYFDPRSYNGALWLGLNGIAVKSHGGADERGFAYALEMIADMISADINNKILKEVSEDKVIKTTEP